jgi:class 3 adenylate cyclase
MQRVSAFALLVICLVLPFWFVEQSRLLERRFAHTADVESIRHVALGELQRIAGSTSKEMQVRRLIREFHRTITAPGAAVSEIASAHASLLSPHFPAHALFVARETSSGTIAVVFSHVASGAFPGELLEPLLSTIHDPLTEDFETEAFETLLAHSFQFPLTRRFFRSAQRERTRETDPFFQILNTPGSQKALCWHFPESSLPRFSVLTLLDWNAPDEFSVMRHLAHSLPPHLGIAFIPESHGSVKPATGAVGPDLPLIAGPLFTTNPEARSTLDRMVQKQIPPFRQRLESNLFFAIAEMHSALPYQVLIAAALPPPSGPPEPGNRDFPWHLLGAVVILGITFKTIAEKLFMNRGPRLSIAFALVTAGLLIPLLPLGGAHLLAQLALHERTALLTQNAANSLHSWVKSIDETYQLVNADLGLRLQQAAASPHVRETLEKEAGSGRIKKTYEELMPFIQPLYPVPLRNEMKFIVLAGPNNLRHFHAETLGGAKKTDVINLAFGGSAQRLLKRLNPDLNTSRSGSDSSSTPPTLSMKSLQTEMAGEYFEDFFNGGLDRNAMYRLINEVNQVWSYQKSYAAIQQINTPVKSQGAPRFLLSYVWDDNHPQRDYCKHHEETPSPLGPNGRFFYSLREEQKATYAADFDRYPATFRQLFSQARLIEMPQSTLAVNGSQSWLLEAYPAKFLTKSILGGAFSLQSLLADETAKKTLLRQGILAGLLCSVLLALYQSLYFLKPLRELIAGIHAIQQRQFHTRLNPDRQDEFGRVATAFNRMACGLEEGAILGKYVSPALRRLIKDPAQYECARQGESREVTVLFSQLIGASHAPRESSAADAFALLGEHLNLLSSATHQFGGEIDKVIGDKIMIFFDHRVLGGPGPAATALLAVLAATARAGVANPALQTAIGVNSGPAVAGILGSRTLRMDYTVIGDAVNLAARLCSVGKTCPEGRIILSKSTVDLLPSGVSLQRIEQSHVKGKTQAIEAYALTIS